MNALGLIAGLYLANGSPVAEYVRSLEWAFNENAGTFVYVLDESELFVKAAIISAAEIEFFRADESASS